MTYLIDVVVATYPIDVVMVTFDVVMATYLIDAVMATSIHIQTHLHSHSYASWTAFKSSFAIHVVFFVFLGLLLVKFVQKRMQMHPKENAKVFSGSDVSERYSTVC